MSALRRYVHPFENEILSYDSPRPLPDRHPRLAVFEPPGSFVRHRDWEKSFGILIANTGDSLLVLWANDVGWCHPFSNFPNPLSQDEDIFIPVRQ